MFESSPRKKEYLCQVVDWIWKIADLFSFSRSLLMRFLEEIQRPEKYSLISPDTVIWMTKSIISVQAKFGDDYSRVRHGGLESVTSVEFDFDCLAIPNTDDLQ